MFIRRHKLIKLFVLVVLAGFIYYLIYGDLIHGVNAVSFPGLQHQLKLARREEEALKWLAYGEKERDTETKEYKSVAFHRKIPQNKNLGRDFDYEIALIEFQLDVTVFMYSVKETVQCIRGRLLALRAELPYVTVMLVAVHPSNITEYETETAKHDVTFIAEDNWTEGTALNRMIRSVSTKYFLYLCNGATIMQNSMDHSVLWLWHAMSVLDELDFVGGSMLIYDESERSPKLEVPCYRLQQCRWIFQQSYQYQYSVDDLMICEETSPSFFGLVSSVKYVGFFDEDLPSMVTTDFFFRAKYKAVTGLRPEMFFVKIKHCCFPNTKNTILAATNGVEIFMIKHKVAIFRDSYSRETVSDSTPVVYASSKSYVYGALINTPDRIQAMNLLFDLTFKQLHNDANTIILMSIEKVMLGNCVQRDLIHWHSDDTIRVVYYGTRRSIIDRIKRFWIATKYERHLSLHYDAIGELSSKMGVVQLRHTRTGVTVTYSNQADINYRPNLVYITVGGRQVLVDWHIFQYARERRAINDQATEWIKKDCPAHHACVPPEVLKGGSNWKDYWCNI